MMPDNFSQSNCFLWTPRHLRPEIYDSLSFYYIRRIILTINSFSAPVSIAGNGILLVTILKTRSLHTTANILIGSLVLADFMVGSIVQTLMMGVMLTGGYNYNCLFVVSFSYTGFAIASISGTTMIAVSCERYIALFFPLRYFEIITTKRAFASAIFIWIGWFAIEALPFSKLSFLVTLKSVIEYIVYVVAFAAISYSYLKIFCLVRRHQVQIQAQLAVANLNDAAKNQLKQSKLAITMCYVIGTSLVCYIPACIVTAVFIDSSEPSVFLFNTFYLVISLQFMSSCVNPIINCWRRREIRQPALALLRSCKERLCCRQSAL